MSYPIPAFCPKCKTQMTWTGGIVSRVRGYYAAECSCGLSGGVANSKEGAAHKWNERVAIFHGDAGSSRAKRDDNVGAK